MIGQIVGAVAVGTVLGYMRGPIPRPTPAPSTEKRCPAGHRKCSTGNATNPGCGCCACCADPAKYPSGCGCTGCYQTSCVCSRPMPAGIHCRECA